MNEEEASKPAMSEDEVRIMDLSYEVADLLEEREALKTSLALLGQDRIAAIESRDRVLFENTAMVQQIRDLKKIAQAAARFMFAVRAFHDNPGSDEAHEAGTSECELELALEKQGLIPRS